MAENNGFELSRAMYKELKSMNREKMQQVLTGIYQQGVESAEVASVDTDKLREELSKINGIGEKRLDEIMAVIERVANLQTKTTSKED